MVKLDLRHRYRTTMKRTNKPNVKLAIAELLLADDQQRIARLRLALASFVGKIPAQKIENGDVA